MDGQSRKKYKHCRKSVYCDPVRSACRAPRSFQKAQLLQQLNLNMDLMHGGDERGSSGPALIWPLTSAEHASRAVITVCRCKGWVRRCVNSREELKDLKRLWLTLGILFHRCQVIFFILQNRQYAGHGLRWSRIESYLNSLLAFAPSDSPSSYTCRCSREWQYCLCTCIVNI